MARAGVADCVQVLTVVAIRKCDVVAWAVHSDYVCSPAAICVTLNVSRDCSQRVCVC